MKVQYASGRETHCSISTDLSGGGNLALAEYFFFLQGRNDCGVNLPGPSSQVEVGFAGESISLEIPAAAFYEGENWSQFIISINTEDDFATSSILLVIDAVDANQEPINLPLYISLTQETHLQGSTTVSSLPTGANLINGMIRTYTPTGLNYRYSETSVATVDGINVLSASPGRWLRFFDPLSSFILDTEDADFGCDTPLQLLTNNRNILDFPYALDGNPGKRRRYWVYNTLPTPLTVSKKIGFTVLNHEEDVTGNYVGLLKTVFEGYWDRNTNTLITTYDDVQNFSYLNTVETFNGTTQESLTLERELLTNQAFQFSVYPEFSVESLTLTGNVPANNSEISILPFIYTNQGRPSDLGIFLGNCVIYTNPNYRRLYPTKGLSLYADSGSGVIGSSGINFFYWSDVPPSTVLGLVQNTADQLIAVDTNGAVYPTTNIGGNEGLRARVSTLAGESELSTLTEPFGGDVNPVIQFTVNYPTQIRPALNDVIAESTKGEFNATSISVYVQKSYAYEPESFIEQRKISGLVVTEPDNETFTINYGDGEPIFGFLPVLPAFGLFAPSTPVNVSATSTGSFVYRIAISFEYDGTTVTDISHRLSDGCISEIQNNLSDLINISADSVYWRAPVVNRVTLRDIAGAQLLNRAIYPVVIANQGLPSMFMYLADSTAEVDNDVFISVTNGPGRFVKITGGSTSSEGGGDVPNAVTDAGGNILTDAAGNPLTFD